MSETEWPRPCPLCGVKGPYLHTPAFTSQQRRPLIRWRMRLCGCEFTSENFYRWGEGWQKFVPGERDARRCE